MSAFESLRKRSPKIDLFCLSACVLSFKASLQMFLCLSSRNECRQSGRRYPDSNFSVQRAFVLNLYLNIYYIQSPKHRSSARELKTQDSPFTLLVCTRIFPNLTLKSFSFLQNQRFFQYRKKMLLSLECLPFCEGQNCKV